jgi:hypothetical protein
MRRLTGLVAGLVALLALAGCTGTPDTGAAPVDGDRGRGEGYSLTVTKLGIDRSPLAPVVLNADRTIQVPPVDRPEQAAIYAGGPMPGELGGGDRVGPAVILGHVNGEGRPGVFARLDELAEGDHVQTIDPRGTPVEFVVYRKVTVDKDDFPTAEVYSRTEVPELRLITCGGDLDRSASSYVGQVIVFARRV